MTTSSIGLSGLGSGTSSLPARLHWLWGRVKETVKRPFYEVYLRRLRAKSTDWQKPRHVGFIMDGNRRFARYLGLECTLGHQIGADKLQEVLGWCDESGIRVVTVWCFSLDNFERSTEEVEALLRLFEDKARQIAEDDQVHRREIRVRFIGRLELLPDSLRAEIRRAEEATAGYDALQLNIAMAYGGREEISDAFRRYLEDCRAQGVGLDRMIEEMEEETIDSYLYTSGQPEPDLILRTSGEIRLSGFLLWQSAYSEFYFSDTHWPAFREIDFLRALRSYDARQRRFGR